MTTYTKCMQREVFLCLNVLWLLVDDCKMQSGTLAASVRPANFARLDWDSCLACCGSKLRKVFNPNTVKLSYSCTPNVATVIKQYNHRVRNTTQANDPAAKLCNCRGGVDVCPLEGECLTKGIVYEAKVIVEGTGNNMIYIGSTSTTFKERYNNHKASLRHEKKQSSTKLSKHVWELKRAGVDHKIKMEDLPQSEGVLHLEQALRPVPDGEALLPDGQEGNSPEQPHRLNLTSQCRNQKKQSLALLTTDPIKIKKSTQEPTHLRTFMRTPLPIVRTLSHLFFLSHFLSLSPFSFLFSFPLIP